MQRSVTSAKGEEGACAHSVKVSFSCFSLSLSLCLTSDFGLILLLLSSSLRIGSNELHEREHAPFGRVSCLVQPLRRER